jgi:deoxyribodipyrimidine photo-lyase
LGDEALARTQLPALADQKVAKAQAWIALARFTGPDRAVWGWARATLEKHAGDERPRCYSLDELERAATHDPLWNAAQRQLLREGVIHNYMRMLWGKKILEWSPSPEEALQRMIHLNNRWAIDGRDPNSWSGIFWVLGRFDRAWGPERPIYGTIRYMSSASTGRKFPVQGYLNQYTGLNAPG